MARNTYTDKENKAGPLQWLIVIVVPLLFAITITLIILTFMGIDVIGKSKSVANQIPILSSVVVTNNEEAELEKIQQIQEELGKRETKIETLNATIFEKETSIKELTTEVNALKAQLKELEENRTANDEILTDISSSFSEMDADSAAPIIANLEDGIAVKVLMKLSKKDRGLILGEMEPKVAADLTNLLLKETP